MPVTRSRIGFHNPSRGASPVRHGDDDDRSPSPLPCTSRGRIQTPSAAAKFDSPPRGRTMTRSASRGASRGGSPQAAVYSRSDADKVKIAAVAAHNQPLNAKYPDSVRAPSVLRGYSDSSRNRPLISLRRALLVPVSEAKVSNATMAVGPNRVREVFKLN